MKKILLIITCLAVLSFASVAQAVSVVDSIDTTSLYGTYTGELAYTNVFTGEVGETQTYQITIGNDSLQQNLEGNQYYLYVPETIESFSEDWQVDWEEVNGRSNSYIAHLENSNFLAFTNANHQAFAASLYFAEDFASFLFSNAITLNDTNGLSILTTTGTLSATPVPGAVWLLGSGLLGLVGLRRRFMS